ncbi:MAG: 1-acyl-sn-glycerol-3-phosphate acyltransferase [Nannocystis sp.]|uniref:lysophospholipid acyltransferase family protein n=1 Tax=Nannocystis sp. TaxID=1962667 RepID=UPI0024206645|nr:lysophospholipid acyltransferase family protein [Nannocystis sp.]MBK9753901.1 1-acyl-sn-glycerol-3-phosphate acyltransferase [Nannocystis sp.]
MLRTAVRNSFGAALRVFFRRIEVVGAERVPATGPVIFVLNHPNALIDPAFLLCLAPRPVSFLAKAPLFQTPVLGWIVRAFDSIPIHRKQDEGGAVDNRDTFKLARELLQRGQTVAIFPEGTSHSEPHLKPLKTGAARIALGTGLADLKIVPTGLYYVNKAKFRSDALVVYGEPFGVEAAVGEPGAEPAAAAVQALTGRIERALGEVLLQADQAEALALVERVSRIFAATSEAPWSLAEGFELRRRVAAGYSRLREADPVAVAAVRARVERYEQDLAALGMSPEHYGPADFTVMGSVRYALRSAGSLLLLLPLALLGTALHLPIYLVIDAIAGRIARDEMDMPATIKLLAAMLLYPLAWITIGVVAGVLWGGAWGVLAGLLAPISAAAALLFRERFATVGAAARGLLLFVTRRNTLARLHGDRMAIRAAIVELARRVEG